MATHEVRNQPPPLEGYNVFAQDQALAEGVIREGAGWAEAQLLALGELAGTPTAIGWGADANTHPPVLRTHDRFGHRIDEVVYHPSYHRLMAVAVERGLHAAPWRPEQPRRGAHVARAAGFYVWSQVDAGHGCPISMTYSVLPALRPEPALLALWRPRLTSLVYDPSPRPAGDKAGALAGMAMTEKQGGSDVRANTTVAVAAEGAYRLTGHKWFCSAPMGDLFLVLAQAPGGLTCFALPRWTPDGGRNPVYIQRLKDKLGNRSNASAEIELDGAWADRVGEEGRGVATIIEMVNHTRLDCVIGAAAGMRQSLAQAAHHCAHRSAFGRHLADQPLMAAVLADLAVEAEAATTTMLRLAGAYDRADDDGHEARFRRLGTAVAKYWLCKRHPAMAAEALECVGGNGYVEESMMPRLFRESPLNGIWEGSGNVICLDVLRAMTRQPESLEAYFAEVARAQGADRRLDDAVVDLRRQLTHTDDIEARARRIVESMALVLQGALLVRFGHPAVADAFCASRLGGDWGRAFGTLPTGADLGAIVARATPRLG
ncbi:MAG: putative acyl-CoA dehydrogenase [Acidimicrobiaceae bacterium]|nr:putative acyl-CoA dehydrogenase [Acidimicrobiaceae bacterium]